MQEQTVQWDPMMEYRMPYELRLFWLYSLIVVVVFFVKCLRIAGQLWSLRKASDGDFGSICNLCKARIDSLKRLVTPTLLLSVLTSMYLITPLLEEIRDAKIAPIALSAGSAVEMLKPIKGGLVISVAFYLAYSLFTGALKRRKIRHDFAPGVQQTSG